MSPKSNLAPDIGLGMLWSLGTFGRSLVFAAWLAGVVAYDNWEANRYPDAGASLIFVLVWPAEAVVAGIWALVDGWRRLSWASLLVRWSFVAIIAGLALTFAEIKIEGVYTWADSPVNLLSQLIAILSGAALGAAIGRYALKPSQHGLREEPW